MEHNRRPDSPRIAVVGLNYAPEATGIAPYTTALSRYLAALNQDVSVITGHPHYPEWELHQGYERPVPPSRDQGVTVIRVRHPVPRNPNGLSRVWMECAYAFRAMLELVRLKPNVVVAVSPALLTLLPVLVLRLVVRCRTGVIVQDLYGAALQELGAGRRRFLGRVVARLEAYLLNCMDAVSVIHPVFAQRLIAWGVPKEKIVVQPNWAHVTFPSETDIAEIRRSCGWSDDEFVALHAGNMGAKQGLEGLVDVARLALKRAPHLRIVLLGTGSRRDWLKHMAADCANVTFLDPLPEGRFERVVSAADCLILHEKSGLKEMSVPSKLTTYFSSGVAVVAATDVESGAAQLISAANAGIIVPSGDAEAFLDAIERLQRDKDLMREMGANGLAFAKDHLSQAAALERLAQWVMQIGMRATN